MRMLPRLMLLLLLWPAACSSEAAPTAPPHIRLLIYTNTAGFKHESVEVGATALMNLNGEQNWYVITTDDPGVFAMSLESSDVAVFMSTTGDVLDDAQQSELQQFIEGGGGFVGIHAAADTEHHWEWYGQIVGAYFASHPAVQEARIEVVDRGHPATAHLEAEWVRTDEWYDYKSLPAGVRVLLKLDESSYEGGKMGADHPIAWCHSVGKGRAFYTGLGHTNESFSEPAFVQHLIGAIRWAAHKAD